MDYKDLEIKVLDIKIRGLDYSQINPGVRHFGGAFSQAHILTALYKEVLRENDEFILSKGHTCATWYPLLEDKGYKPEILGHPKKDIKNSIPMTMGSLGRGYNFAAGIALAKKINNDPGKVYTLLGDGECQEGTFWELLTSVGNKYKLDNLVAIIDKNNIQGSGRIEDVLPLENIAEIAKLNNWYAGEINGHNFNEIIPALRSGIDGMPTMIVANTIKGKGVSFMEDQPIWHSKAPSKEEYNKAREELIFKYEALK